MFHTLFSIMRFHAARIWRRLFPLDCHYINGPDTLPPPLTKAQEAQVLEEVQKGVPGAREPLITHNLRLVVYIAKKFEFKFEFYLGFPEIVFLFEFYLWKNVHVVGLIPLRIYIYICPI